MTKLLNWHTPSLFDKIQESCCKFLARWYRFPDKLLWMSPSTSTHCWRDCGQRGTFLHLWWEYLLIKPYWTEIHNFIATVAHRQLEDDPLPVVFHATFLSVGKYKQSLLPHLLNACKSLILVHWKSTMVPTVRGWLLKVLDIQLEEWWRYHCLHKFS